MRENVIVWLRSLRSTIFSVWLAYTVVWMAYGLRLISSTLLQVGRSLKKRRAAPERRAGRSPATSPSRSLPLRSYRFVAADVPDL